VAISRGREEFQTSKHPRFSSFSERSGQHRLVEREDAWSGMDEETYLGSALPSEYLAISTSIRSVSPVCELAEDYHEFGGVFLCPGEGVGWPSRVEAKPTCRLLLGGLVVAGRFLSRLGGRGLRLLLALALLHLVRRLVLRPVLSPFLGLVGRGGGGGGGTVRAHELGHQDGVDHVHGAGDSLDGEFGGGLGGRDGRNVGREWQT